MCASVSLSVSVFISVSAVCVCVCARARVCVCPEDVHQVLQRDSDCVCGREVERGMRSCVREGGR